MGVFSSNAIGVDLGSSMTSVALGGVGVVLREPTCILTRRENVQEVITVGREARQLLGRTNDEVTLVSPILDGAVADTDLTALILLALTEKATDKRKPFEKARLAATMSQGVTRVEHAALDQALVLAGAKHAVVVRTPLAAAIGAGRQVDSEKGFLLISIGGSITEISVISMYAIVAARTMRTGSAAFDDAIVRYVRREKGLVIGLKTAEDLKCDIGTADADKPSKAEVVLRGRNLETGKPTTVPITENDIYRALQEPINAIVDAIRDAIANTPAELAADLVENGIFLTGGGAQLDGLARRIEKETKLNVSLSEHPEQDAVLGACMVAGDDKLTRQLVGAGSAFEI